MNKEESDEGQCSCNEEGCSCGQDNCCDEEKGHTGMILGLANAAWTELLKEKMKKAYEKAAGSKMDKIAAIGVEANIEMWRGKMQEKAKWAEFEEKLDKAMNE